jgi:hypothetical protein
LKRRTAVIDDMAGGRRSVANFCGMRAMYAVAVTAALAAVAIAPAAATPAVSSPRHAPPVPAARHSTWYAVGAAKESITPRSLKKLYLGGYGIGPVHLAKAVLRPIYARAIAVRDPAGHQVVITTIDVQGQFLAYRSGAYGFADMAASLHRTLRIPVANFLFSSTHTHNGPDDLGIWGGVPRSYLRRVAVQTEKAVRLAVRRERPARLRWTAVKMRGFNETFANDGDADDGDLKDFPVDQTMRVLQAVDRRHRVVATLLNYASHATVYGPLNKVSPDWPGAAATYLEHDERGMPRHRRYGYPHSTAIVVEADLGHTWPGGIPHNNVRALDPPKSTDDNFPADAYGDAIARRAMAAIGRDPHAVSGGVAGARTSITVANNNPVLLAGLANPVDGLQAYRADLPPYGVGDALTTTVAALRVGRLLFAGAPGEEYPTINLALRSGLTGATVFPVGLADDQLGYLGTPADYVAAQECSLTDEGFFTISPLFGNQVLQGQRRDARALGFEVGSGRKPTEGGKVPVNGVCLSQQLP